MFWVIGFEEEGSKKLPAISKVSVAIAIGLEKVLQHLQAVVATCQSELRTCLASGRDVALNPDPREDLESRSPNLGPYTTKGTL